MVYQWRIQAGGGGVRVKLHPPYDRFLFNVHKLMMHEGDMINSIKE